MSNPAINNRRVRWGILGWARIARVELAPALLRSRNCALHALASRDPAKFAEARAACPTLQHLHNSYGALLDDPEVEAVYIPLPNSLHCEWAVRALERGKHVLCEKPLALDAAQARRMADAARANGVHLMEAFMYRYTARTQAVAEVLRSGVLGEVKFVHSSFRFLLANPASIKLRPELGGGSLYDVGCYPVNFAGMAADLAAGAAPGTLRPESVSVQCVRSGGIDEIFSALLKYPSGLIASLHCGFNAQKRIGAEITGTKGSLEIPDAYLDNAGSLVLAQGEERREISVPASDRYRAEVEDFAAAILEGRPPQLGLDESLRNMETLDRLRSAAG